jgi:PAS domain-containing protein
MQNEELRQAQIALEESRDRYVDLYEFAPVGYFTLTREGMIAEVNLTGAALLGVDRKKLINRRFASFVAAGKRDYWNQHFLSVLKCDGRQSCELELQHDEAPPLRARLDCLRMEADGISSVRVALADLGLSVK